MSCSRAKDRTGPSSGMASPGATATMGLGLTRYPRIESLFVQSSSPDHSEMNSPRHLSRTIIPTQFGRPGVLIQVTGWLSGFAGLHLKAPIRSGSPTHSKPPTEILPSLTPIVPSGSRDETLAGGIQAV